MFGITSTWWEANEQMDQALRRIRLIDARVSTYFAEGSRLVGTLDCPEPQPMVSDPPIFPLMRL